MELVMFKVAIWVASQGSTQQLFFIEIHNHPIMTLYSVYLTLWRFFNIFIFCLHSKAGEAKVQRSTSITAPGFIFRVTTCAGSLPSCYSSSSSVRLLKASSLMGMYDIITYILLNEKALTIFLCSCSWKLSTTLCFSDQLLSQNSKRNFSHL